MHEDIPTKYPTIIESQLDQFIALAWLLNTEYLTYNNLHDYFTKEKSTELSDLAKRFAGLKRNSIFAEYILFINGCGDSCLLSLFSFVLFRQSHDSKTPETLDLRNFDDAKKESEKYYDKISYVKEIFYENPERMFQTFSVYRQPYNDLGFEIPDKSYCFHDFTQISRTCIKCGRKLA